MNIPTAVFIGILVLFAVAASSLPIVLIRFFNKDAELKAVEKELEQLRDENRKTSTIDYSDKALTFTRTFVTQVALIKYKEFMANNDLDKVTRAHLKPVVKDVAMTVHKALDMDIKGLLFSKEYYDNYIIDVAVTTIRDMFDADTNKI